MKFVLSGENNVKVVISEGANGYEELLSAWQNIQRASEMLRQAGGYMLVGGMVVGIKNNMFVGFKKGEESYEFYIPIKDDKKEIELKDVETFLKAGEYAGFVPFAYEEQKQKTLSQVYERLKSLYDFASENGLNPKEIILYYDPKAKQEVSLAELVNGGLEKLGEYDLREIEVVGRNIDTAKRVIEKHLENIQSRTASPNL
ncbi:MAG: hypothetical protein QW733_01900 [Desulfurococcaceae archaeon]